MSLSRRIKKNLAEAESPLPQITLSVVFPPGAHPTVPQGGTANIPLFMVKDNIGREYFELEANSTQEFEPKTLISAAIDYLLLTWELQGNILGAVSETAESSLSTTEAEA